MAAVPIEAKTQEEVLSVWEMHDKPPFSLWNGTRIAFSCNEPDEESRQEMLHKYLEIIKQGGTTATYIIKFHDESDKKINNNTPFIGSLNFRLTDPMALETYTGGGAPARGENIALLTQIFEQKFELYKKDQELEKLQREQDEADIEETDFDSEDTLGKIGRVVDRVGEAGEKYPWLQGAINKLITTVTDVITVGTHKAGKMFEGNNSAQMAGIANEAQEAPTMSATQQSIERSISILTDFYIATHRLQLAKANPEATEEQITEAATVSGGAEFAKDLAALAEITKNPKLFGVAIRNLRDLA